MADIGQIALILAVACSLYAALAFFIGTTKGQAWLVTSARNAVLATLGLVTLASLTLIYALITHHFEISYVASHTSRDMSLVYILSAFWAGNAGSLLLWAWLLSIFAVTMVIQNWSRSKPLLAYASIVAMLTEAFFLILIVAVANPFEKLHFTPNDGFGLNPLLENPGMLFHPPALLGGYVAFTIPFALAIAAMITAAPDREWLGAARSWALLAWLLLGIGNVIGAWWAYVELGWGGYWAWDPVENAGLMPWLVGTAFLHSVAMQRRRGMFKIWVMALIILAFNLCIFGTFLTRSNILSSVHTFNEAGMEPFFLTFIGISLVGSLGLLFYRRNSLRSEKGAESLVSKEASFTLTNVVLLVGTFVVLLGTIFPLISEGVRGVSTSVSESFFNRVMGPIFLLLILVLGICGLLGWRRTKSRSVIRSGLPPLAAALLLCPVLFVIGIREWYALVLFPFCAFVAFSQLATWYREVMARRRVKGGNPLTAFLGSLQANKPRYGGMIVHLGIILIAVGVIGSSFYQVEAEAALMPGDSMTIKGYTLTYEGMSLDHSSTKMIVITTLSVYNSDKLVGELKPEKIFHRSYEQTVTEVAIRSTPIEDLYLILAGWTEDGTVTFKALVNPLMLWIWVGGGFLLLGGVIAFWPGRSKESKTDSD